MILADEKFRSFESRTVGDIVPTHGFSSCKFLPGSRVSKTLFWRVFSTRTLLMSELDYSSTGTYTVLMGEIDKSRYGLFDGWV